MFPDSDSSFVLGSRVSDARCSMQQHELVPPCEPLSNMILDLAEADANDSDLSIPEQ